MGATTGALGHGIHCIDAGYLRPGVACFYLLCRRDECAVIETGTSHSLPRLQSLMNEMGLAPEQLRYVIPTHVHLDHAGGAGQMMETFPNAELLIHPRGARHMADPTRLVASAVEVYGEASFQRLYGEILPVAVDRIRELEDGESVRLGGSPLTVRHTRGHAEHHFCLWDELSRGWFSGDMFGISYPWFRFRAGDFLLPATTPTQFDPGAYLQSVDLLASYHPRRIYLTHFGELAFSPATASLLKRQVRDYGELARGCAGDGAALRRALEDYSLAQIRRVETGTREETLREQLGFDMDLNTQGLQVWLQRSAGVS